LTDTPVLLIVFNRPDTTRRVFEAIRQAQPRRLFVAADAPRIGRPDDLALCDETRSIATAVDWECDVQTLFRDENLGCGLGICTAVSWFLSNVSEGIIFEDDTLPDQSFFRYCEELLRLYRHTPRVMMISGANFLGGKSRGTASYYFSRYTHAWGWATWSDSWAHFDRAVNLAEIRRRGAYAWKWYDVVRQRGGLSVTPNVNLVSNIGCGAAGAVHCADVDPVYADVPTVPLPFPLVHPTWIRGMDRYPDYSILVHESRSYRGAPAKYARLAYRRAHLTAGTLYRRIPQRAPRP
jgi:hypothetical protein